jgi:hypothetical protein
LYSYINVHFDYTSADFQCTSNWVISLHWNIIRIFFNGTAPCLPQSFLFLYLIK